MEISKSVRTLADVILQDKSRIISIVGGGGKTSTIGALGECLAANGLDVILTTTTRILPFQGPLPEGVRCIGEPAENGKLKSVEHPEKLLDDCDVLLIEADGSKGLPVKMPASHEPVIIPETDMVIAVMGLTGIGKPIGKVCHRPEIVSAFLGKQMDDVVTEEDAAKIILSKDGLSKNVEGRRFAVVFNQADTEKEEKIGEKIASILPEDVILIMTKYERC